MKASRSEVTRVVIGILECPDMKRVTAFVGEKLTVKATRPKKYRKNGYQDTIVLTVGRPNYAEREYIKTLRKCGESLPCKRLKLKWWKK